MKKIMYIAVALLVLVGCQKSQEAKENAPVNYGTITGKIKLPQGPNKIAAPEGWASAPANDPFTMQWEEGDEIYINNGVESKLLTLKSIDGDGVATFEGELLNDMSSYMVYYGFDPSNFTNMAVPYIEGNYRPFAMGMNTTAESFTIDMFFPVFGMPLKGTTALTKIEAISKVASGSGFTDCNLTMTFDTPLQLTSTSQTVYFPIFSSIGGELPLTFKFYDANGLILTKEIEKATCLLNQVITFSSALEVNGTAEPTPTLIDVFEDGATFEFGITLNADGPVADDFAFKNQNGTFTCTKVFLGGEDWTETYAPLCSVSKDPSENLFTFILGDEDQNIIFDADNNSYAISERLVTDFKLTSFDYFKVNGVDITSTLINETDYEE